MNLRKARLKAGLSQSQLAKLLGVSVCTISRIERELRRGKTPRSKILERALELCSSGVQPVNPSRPKGSIREQALRAARAFCSFYGVKRPVDAGKVEVWVKVLRLAHLGYGEAELLEQLRRLEEERRGGGNGRASKVYV